MHLGRLGVALGITASVAGAAWAGIPGGEGMLQIGGRLVPVPWQFVAARHSQDNRLSKQRPSTRSRAQSRRASNALPTDSLAFWRRRVFRNTYTRQGRTLRVKRWSVKFQHQGKRRTFSLAGVLRAEAAREAQSIYQIIRTEGWDAALQAYERAAPVFHSPEKLP